MKIFSGMNVFIVFVVFQTFFWNSKGQVCQTLTNCDSCLNSTSACVWCSTNNIFSCENQPNSCNYTVSFCGASTSTGGSLGTSTTGIMSSTTGSVINQLPIATFDSNATCQGYYGEYCSGVIFYNVFVNDTYRQEQADEDAKAVYAFSGFSYIPDDCKAIAEPLTCGNFFTKCEYLPQYGVSVSIPVCRDICDKFVSACSAVLQTAAPELIPDCDGIDAVTGGEAYPVENITYRMPNGDLVTFPCNNMDASQAGGYFPNKLINGNFEYINESKFIGWETGNFSANYSIANETSLSNNSTILAFSGIGGENLGLKQFIFVNRTKVFPFRVGGMSKAVNVSGTPGSQYALVIDIIYNDNSTAKIIIEFNTSSHDFEKANRFFTPGKPVQSITFYVVFNQSGLAYFDNLFLEEQIPETGNEVTCFDPLVFKPSADGESQGTCEVPCPVRFYDSDTTFKALQVIELVCAYLSLVGSAFIILSWIVLKPHRKYPDRLSLYYGISTFIVALSQAIDNSVPLKDSICVDEFTYATQSLKPWCGFSGALLQFGALSAILWWVFIVTNTWLMIKYHMQRKNFANLEKYFLIIGWGIPAVSVAISLGMNQFGANWTSTGGCWLLTNNNSAYQFALFYGPLGLALLLGTPMVLHSLSIIYIITKNAPVGDKSRRSLQIYLRPLAWLGIIMFGLIFLFAFKFYTYRLQEELTSLLEEEISCKVQGNLNCKETRVNLLLLVGNQICAGLQGFAGFCFFGIQRKNLELWKDLLCYGKTTSTKPTGSAKTNSNKSDSEGGGFDLHKSSSFYSEASIELPAMNSDKLKHELDPNV